MNWSEYLEVLLMCIGFPIGVGVGMAIGILIVYVVLKAIGLV